MKIFMTGATGFIGSNLARRLVADRHEVQVLVRGTSSLEIIDDIRNEIGVTVYDGELSSLTDALERLKPDLVIHVASLFLARHQPEEVAKLISSNIDMPSKLLEAMVLTGLGHFINTGTSWQHYEDADFSPVNLYAATKQAFEDILTFYTEAQGIRAITLKLFDTYGPNDPRPKLFSLLRRMAESGDVLKMSPGEQLLDLVYVDDVIDAYVSAIEGFERLAGQSYAVSSRRRHSLREVARIYGDVIGKMLNIDWGGLPYRPRETLVPWTRGQQLPDWKPRVDLVEGIRRTVHSAPNE